MDFDIIIPEKLVFYNQYPALGLGYLSIKMGNKQYLADLKLDKQQPIFVDIGVPTSDFKAVEAFHKRTQHTKPSTYRIKFNPYIVPIKNEFPPIIDMDTYKSMELSHIVGMEVGIGPANVGCPSVSYAVKAELLNNKIALPDIEEGLAVDKNSTSYIWIDINIDKDGKIKSGFGVDSELRR